MKILHDIHNLEHYVNSLDREEIFINLFDI